MNPNRKRNRRPALLPSDLRTVPLHDEIATQAHMLWEHYGRPTGRDVSIWLEAERQVLGVDGEVSQQAGGAIPAAQLGETLHRGVATPEGASELHDSAPPFRWIPTAGLRVSPDGRMPRGKL